MSSNTISVSDEPLWLKSRASMGAGACVQLAEVGDMIALRDSKHPENAPHLFTHAEIRAFFAAIRLGEFDHLVKNEEHMSVRRRTLPASWTCWPTDVP
jgi:hypothetical protein